MVWTQIPKPQIETLPPFLHFSNSFPSMRWMKVWSNVIFTWTIWGSLFAPISKAGCRKNCKTVHYEVFLESLQKVWFVSVEFYLLLFHLKMSTWPYSFNTLFKMLVMCILALPHVRIWGFTPYIMIQIQCNVLCSTLAGSKLGFSHPAKFRPKSVAVKWRTWTREKKKQRNKTMIQFFKCPIWGL